MLNELVKMIMSDLLREEGGRRRKKTSSSIRRSRFSTATANAAENTTTEASAPRERVAHQDSTPWARRWTGMQPWQHRPLAGGSVAADKKRGGRGAERFELDRGSRTSRRRCDAAKAQTQAAGPAKQNYADTSGVSSLRSACRVVK